MLVKTVRAALALLLIILAAAAHAQTTVTLQQGLNSYTGATDNWISCCRTANAPNENYGSEVEVDMRLPGDFGLYRFNIFQSEGGPVPNGATITSATLSLYKAFGGDGVFKASRLLKNWTELGSTWNATGTGTQWSTAGAQGAGTDVLATADGQGSAPDSAANNCADGIGHDICWVNINVTTGVQAFANGSSQNFGWLVQMVSSSATGAYKDFNSKDSTNFPLFRPKLTVTYTPASGTTAVLQQGLNNYAGATDNWISCCRTANAPNENYGSQVEIDMRLPGDFGLYRFNIFQSEGGPVPNGATINSAILSLYKSFGSDAVFKASRLLKNWTELGSTWNSTGTGTQWSTAGAQGAGTDVLATADGQGSAPDSVANNCADGVGHEICWLNINVTSGVQAFASGAAQNFGWLVQMVSSSATGAYKDFNSKDSTTFPQYRPKLTINYSGGTPPSCTTVPTASFTATPSSGQAPLGVTFDASASADGDSPITSLRLQFGDATPDATWSSKTQPQVHTYTTATVFNATLTATNACGTSAAVTRTITVTAGPNTPPTAQLTAAPRTGAPLTFDFDASGSTQGSAAITGLRLVFGDDTPDATWTDRTQRQSHSYAARTAPYNATLTVTDANGLTGTKTVQVSANDGSLGACRPSSRQAATNGVAIATFHSMSLYYNPSQAPVADQIFLRYRLGSDDETNPAVWKQGHALWYDARNAHPYHGRGSAVHLQPGTAYVFEVSTDNVNWQYIRGENGEDCPSTWSETDAYPIGLVSQRVWSNTNTSTTSSPYLGTHGGSRNHVLLANESGTSSGYTLYDFTGRNAIAQTSNTSNFFPVVISGHHIILKGLKVVGGESGIFIDPGSHDIVIDGCEITGYGRDSGTALGSGLTGNRAVAEDAGIKFPNGLFGPILETKRIVIQHSKIHNPAFGTNPWNGGAHPLGTTPILIYPTGGQIVIRYNEAYSTTNGLLDGPPDLNHFHEDGLTTTGCETPSEDNYTTVCASSQGIGPNVDIYKNVIMDYWDDGLETDGDGTNNRVWWNYIDYGGASAVSTRPAGTGPVYVWRNVYNRARQYFGDTQGTFAWGAGICNNHQNPTTPCEWDRSYMFKAGGEATVQGGRRYFYNNTALQAPASSEHDAAGPLPLGAGYGAGGTGDGTADLMDNTWTRNNVFAIMKNGVFEQVSGNRDFDYDLTNGVMGSGITETHGIVQTSPAYQNENATDGTANGWRSYWRGKYRLQPGTPGHDDGAVIPNFTDNAVGTPDRGAHEDGTPDMDFGTTASGS